MYIVSQNGKEAINADKIEHIRIMAWRSDTNEIQIFCSDAYVNMATYRTIGDAQDVFRKILDAIISGAHKTYRFPDSTGAI